MFTLPCTRFANLTLTLALLVGANLTHGQGVERTSFSKEELITNSYTWLAGADNRDMLQVYKLSCPNCIEELKAAFEQHPKDIGLINFSTFKKEDRPLAQALIATTLTYREDSKRAEVFGELLGLFVNSAYQFLKNPQEWRTLCLGFWNADEYSTEDPRPWADALNWMDRQNRINILMDLTGFPGSLELKEINSIPIIPKQTYRDQFLFVALSLPWLKYPAVHPIPGQPEAANHPENLTTVIVNPLYQYPASEWQQFANTAKAGAFWNFVGEPEINLHPRMLEFLAAFLDLPTDQARADAFVKAISAVAGKPTDPPKSILATLPRIKKELPKAAPKRKADLMAEARQMSEAFLIYDHLRN
jgi:hypothetical protein